MFYGPSQFGSVRSSGISADGFNFDYSGTEKNERAKTRIGTPRYVSPEVLQGKEYLFSTDIWSLGNIPDQY